jgi:hypothetical protein
MRLQPNIKPRLYKFSLWALSLIIFLLGSQSLSAQNIVDFKQDTTAKTRFRSRVRRADTALFTKHFGRGTVFLGLAELTPWVFDRFIRNSETYYVTPKIIGQHLSLNSWQFDNDPFSTNQFAHPYHGSYFFSAFRTNGYSFWQAAPATFLGSYIWETASEVQAPAPNDFINTGFGGTILGEMTYRISNRIVNNRSRGFKRTASEVLALMINPMNGVTRILDGRWGKIYGNNKERDSAKISAVFDLGVRTINGNGAHTGAYAHARFLYGTAYENYKVPFSNMYIDTELGKDDSSVVNILSVYGSLAGWRVTTTDHVKQLLILSANYDYVHNQAFFYSAQSVKFNFISNFALSKKTSITATVAAGPVLLAGVPDPHLYTGRDYDYTSGIAYSFSTGINLASKLTYNINYRGGWLKTINGYSSYSLLYAITTEVSYAFLKNISLSVEPGVFALNSKYDNYPKINSRYDYFRASVRYGLNM